MKSFLQGIKDVEEAREDTKQPSFMTLLFAGEPDFRLLMPFPRQSAEEKAIGDAICAKVAAILVEHVDPAQIERTGVIPRDALDALAEIGCFGLNIPQRYGGVGLSQTNYNRVLELVGSYCNILALLLSAHQSIGVSRPVLLFGTEEQREKWLPIIARGAVSAFALTEPTVGSDPANMRCTATLSADGQSYLINGEKLWCTNGTIADLIVLVAKVNGRPTAFIVDMQSPGIDVLHRCEFMGCRGIENAWIKFTDVVVPRENVIGSVGGGLKIALTTLNTGRISLASLCLGMAKQIYQPTISWTNTRETFGQKIGCHELNSHKLARLAARIFSMEAVAFLVTGMIDRQAADFRVESAIAKLYCSETLWNIVDTSMQIHGGRGYEKATSIQARGEPGAPIEQLFRDARLYLVGEGASEILKLFIAREVLDPHIKRAKSFFERRGLDQIQDGVKMVGDYTRWYLQRLSPDTDTKFLGNGTTNPALLAQLKYVRRTSRRLSRVVFQLMVRYTTSLERRQALVARIADIGIDLFVISATALYSDTIPESQHLAGQVFDDARSRIEANFASLNRNSDPTTTRLGQDVMRGAYSWLQAEALQSRETAVA